MPPSPVLGWLRSEDLESRVSLHYTARLHLEENNKKTRTNYKSGVTMGPTPGDADLLGLSNENPGIQEPLCF